MLNLPDYYKGYYKIKPQKAISTHTPITEIHDNQYKCMGEDGGGGDFSHTAGESGSALPTQAESGIP